MYCTLKSHTRSKKKLHYFLREQKTKNPRARSHFSHQNILNPRLPLFFFFCCLKLNQIKPASPPSRIPQIPNFSLYLSSLQLVFFSPFLSPNLLRADNFGFFVISVKTLTFRVLVFCFVSMASEALEEKKSEEEAPAVEESKPGAEKEQIENDGPMDSAENEAKEEADNEEVKGEEEADNERMKGEEETEREGAEKGESLGNEGKEEEAKDKSEEVVESKKSKRGSKKSSKNSTEKKVKEPVTPSSDRPTRERKVVERYSVPEPGRSAAKPFSIEKGRGTPLKDIPNVAFKLSKRKPDDNLQMLHLILYGKKGKIHNLKKNIGQFSGYVWVKNEEKQKAKVREKLDKCVKEKLMDFCDVLNITINRSVVKKEELTVKILEFLESPHSTTDLLLADKEQKGKKRKVSTGKNVSPSEASTTPAKRRKQTPQRGQKRKYSSKDEEDDEDKDESPDSEDNSEDDGENEAGMKDESDHEETKSEEEEDEPKEHTPSKKSKKSSKLSSVVKSTEKATHGKKSTPAKPVKSSEKSTKKSSDSSSKKDAKDTDGTSGSVSKSRGSASKKQKVEKEKPKDRSASSKDKIIAKKQSTKTPSKASAKVQGKAKSNEKAKAEPTRQEMHAVVVNILKEVDFNTATLSDILRQLGAHFGIDLMHRKAEVKDIITDVINSMSDDEEEAEEEEAGDADKDGDDEDD
ncbi:hypothetical protein OIU85_013543 [Salix viminalis]|uniref:DEK-C domain-containing protein n=1 Tax=Salix viminalis TaxID=40686 RepID=A0A9Q0NLZ3_SALVM|nr:hypothetical protein OIU85_013543 [Salix viminalis]